MVRAGISNLVSQIDGFHVIGEASNHADALALVRQHRPDVLVADITLGEQNGLDLLVPVAEISPHTRVLILSMHASEELVAEALQLGAAAYLLKESAPGELDIALQAVVRGDSCLSPTVSKKMIERYVRPKSVADNPLDVLTARQQHI